jgi:uroporphyrinogen decarboxylase
MKPTITSKERVQTALAHQEADRVPIDYSANPDIDARLKRHFGLARDDHEGLCQALGVDFRHVGARYTGPKLHPDIPERGILVDDWGIRRQWIEHSSGGYWDYCDWPLQNATEEEIARWPLPSPDDYEYASIEAACREKRDYFVVAGDAGTPDIINSNGMLRTMDQTLVDLITDDPVGLLLADRRIESRLEVLRRTLEAARGGIDLLYMGEDLGTQRGPTISLELYRKHFRPRHQKFVDLARSFDIPVMIHCCGSSSWAFDDFIEMGITVIDTLQPEAKDMAPSFLKQRYGDRLSFHGMISTAGPVAYGSVEQTVQNCVETLEIMKPGGGYCFAPTHALQDNSPTENVVAMYQAAARHGVY